MVKEEEKNTSLVAGINNELNRELADPKVVAALLATTFKGLTVVLMKQALMEGMIRGFTFKNFLEKDVYAIPFKDSYSLVTSIDFARKKGMRSQIVGKNAPVFEFADDKSIISCSVTVKRLVSGIVGEFTATVYFDEYYKKGKEYNGRYSPTLWDTKPRTMIAKVAEMHALRMACPEELSQTYIEEEFDSENKLERIKGVETLLKGGDLKMGNFVEDEKNSGKKEKEGEEDRENGASAGGAEKTG